MIRPLGAAPVPLLVAAGLYVLLFAGPLSGLAVDWWNDPDAGHGLLLAPVSIWLVWRAGFVAQTAPAQGLGLAMIGVAVLVRYASALAAELYTSRLSALLALGGLIVFVWGWRQLTRWWLPALLLILSVPLPDVIISTLALPLQLKASALGATLLELRHVPVRLAGNVILLPGHSLFVTEACSGLRSLTALVSLGVLAGGLWLGHPVSRIALVALSIPVAILINAVRVFLTGFLVFFVSTEAGTGFMHLTEGWLLFLVAMLFLGALAWILGRVEQRVVRKKEGASE